MKQVEAETYNVAWFKLADCIARGEKERALGVFRLLSHSFDDSGLATQLYADILRSFDDPQALNKYQEAAEIYRSRQRYVQAAAVYEHLITMAPDTITFRVQLIELYQQLALRSKVIHAVRELVNLLLRKNAWKKAIEMVLEYETVGDNQFSAQLHEQLLFYLLTIDEVLSDTMLVHAKRAIDAWQAREDEEAIAQFISKIHAVNETIGRHAQEYWQNIKK